VGGEGVEVGAAAGFRKLAAAGEFVGDGFEGEVGACCGEAGGGAADEAVGRLGEVGVGDAAVRVEEEGAGAEDGAEVGAFGVGAFGGGHGRRGTRGER
jgi:hypothetical protein